MQYSQMSIDPPVMSCAAVFAGTRIPIKNLFDYIKGEDDLTEFLDDFPSVTKDAALCFLEMAQQFIISEKALHENFA